MRAIKNVDTVSVTVGQLARYYKQSPVRFSRLQAVSVRCYESLWQCKLETHTVARCMSLKEMFDNGTVRLKEPSHVRWLSYLQSSKVLIDNYGIVLIELEGAWRSHNDNKARGVYAHTCESLQLLQDLLFVCVCLLNRIKC